MAEGNGHKYVCKNCFLSTVSQRTLSSEDKLIYRDGAFVCGECGKRWEAMMVAKGSSGRWFSVAYHNFNRYRPSGISPLTDLQMCVHVRKRGECSFPRCTFPHSQAELAFWDEERNHEPREPPASDEWYRFDLCRNIGHCPFRRRCKFAHSEKELKMWSKSINSLSEQTTIEEQERQANKGHCEGAPFITEEMRRNKEFPPLKKPNELESFGRKLREDRKPELSSREEFPPLMKPKELESSGRKLREDRKPEISNQKELHTQSMLSGGAGVPKGNSQTVHTVTILDDSDFKTDNEELGKGAYGIVYKGTLKRDGKTVAIKVTHSPASVAFPPQESKVWGSIPPHENITELIGVARYKDPNSPQVLIYTVTEIAVNGSLYDYLHESKKNPSIKQSLKWALDVANGMKHVHDHDVIHRDLNSKNVLLSDAWVAKLCDFGTARELTHTVTTKQAGTYRWMSPEVMKKSRARINKKCDLFSYGMILFELFAHEIPYSDCENEPDVLQSVINGKRPPIPPTLPRYLHDLLEKCWNEESHLRPTFDDFVNLITPE